jgi:hypothetical protein
LPTTPGETLPIDTRPRITNVVVESTVPSGVPALVNITGLFFYEGIRLTVTAPDARVQRFEGWQIHDLTRSSFEVRVPLPAPGVYHFSVQSPEGAGTPTFALPIGE